MRISFEEIDEVKAKLGDSAKDIIAKGLNIEKWDGNKGCSPFKNENTPSFIWNSKENCFKCFSTGRRLGIIDYFQLNEKLTYKQAVKKLFDLTSTPYLEDDFLDKQPKNIFDNFRYAKDEKENDRKIVNEYMAKRCISEDTLNYGNVKQDEHGNIAFQFFDVNGDLIQTKYRVSKPSTNKDKYKWTWQKNSDTCPMFYGIDKIDPSKPLLICEGLNDRLACIEAGFTNVVSIPGGANDYNWIDFNYDFLMSVPSLIIWSDDDSAGELMRNECVSRLGMARTKVVLPNKEIKNKISEYFSSRKLKIDKIDANNVLVICGKEDVLRMINNAEEVPNPYVVDLMEVEEVDLSSLHKISTGIKALDKKFYGTFDNSFTVITGKSSNGKSCIINTMFIASPLENDETIFIYSGEFPDGMLLGNVLKPLASRRHILRFENPGLPDGYTVQKDASKSIKEFYKGKIKMHHDENPLNTNSQRVFESMVYSYKRFGVKTFIIDSLMTLDCSTEKGDSELKQQEQFCKRLAAFAHQYPVKVCLVAHFRKLATGVKDGGQDDIAGTGSIVKLANRVFSVEKLSNDSEGFDTKITCLKDRESGKSDSFVKLFFDPPTTRVYTDIQERDYMYKWEYKYKYKYSPTISEKIVANQKEKEDISDEIFG